MMIRCPCGWQRATQTYDEDGQWIRNPKPFDWIRDRKGVAWDEGISHLRRHWATDCPLRGLAQ